MVAGDRRITQATQSPKLRGFEHSEDSAAVRQTVELEFIISCVDSVKEDVFITMNVNRCQSVPFNLASL